MTRSLQFALAATAIALTPACAQNSVDTADKEAVEQIVRAYILENPEIIEEALIALQAKQQQAEQARAQDAILANTDRLFNSQTAYSIGPDDAAVTVVEFFDYRCGFCKRTADWALGLPEQYDNKVRVVFKELPILSAESEQAALAAIAAGEQGKYAEMHQALMALDNSSGFDEAAINGAALEAGVDIERMRADMTSMEVQKAVADAKALARDLSISGTPNFIVGDQMVSGADVAAVQELIEAALKEVS